MPGGSWSSFMSLTPRRQHSVDRRAFHTAVLGSESTARSKHTCHHQRPLWSQQKVLRSPCDNLFHCINFRHKPYPIWNILRLRDRNLSLCQCLFCISVLGSVRATGSVSGLPTEVGLELAVFIFALILFISFTTLTTDMAYPLTDRPSRRREYPTYILPLTLLSSYTRCNGLLSTPTWSSMLTFWEFSIQRLCNFINTTPSIASKCVWFASWLDVSRLECWHDISEPQLKKNYISLHTSCESLQSIVTSPMGSVKPHVSITRLRTET